MSILLDTAETKPRTNPASAIRAVIYTRVSSIAQSKKGHGLQSQETRCREFSRMKNYQVTQVFSDDAISGGVIDRPGIQKMLQYLQAQQTDTRHVVVIDDISRMARDIRAHLDLRDAITAAGASLESPSIEFGEDSDSILVENLLASVSQHQRQKNAEQTKNRMRARMMNGYWPFHACLGYKFESVTGRGKMLIRDEPLASIIQEALEGYASGRFQIQAEVKRFLENQPAFPKSASGLVTYEHVYRLLRRFLYAGMVGSEDWGVSMRKGQHEGLIDFETYTRIQERLTERARAPARADINQDFALRGAVACADCTHPMTGSWSTSKTGKKHPYYMCFKKGCVSYRKSIRRDQLEGDFAALLQNIRPAKKMVELMRTMFVDLWSQLSAQGAERNKALKADNKSAETQIENLLDRIVEADSPAIIKAYEKRISKLEGQRQILSEKLAKSDRPKRNFEELFELAMTFLSNPHRLWDTGVLAHRQIVLRLSFATPPRYCRDKGFSNPIYALPFKALGQNPATNFVMAERVGFEPTEPRGSTVFKTAAFDHSATSPVAGD